MILESLMTNPVPKVIEMWFTYLHLVEEATGQDCWKAGIALGFQAKNC